MNDQAEIRSGDFRSFLALCKVKALANCRPAVVAMLAILLGSPAGLLFGEAAFAAPQLETLVQAWRELAENYDDLSGGWTEIRQDGSGKELEGKRREFTFCFRGERWRIEILRPSTPGTLTVFAGNPENHFEVDRNHADESLYVGGFKDNRVAANSGQGVAGYYYGSVVQPAVHAGQTNLLKKAEDGRLSLKEIKLAEDGKTAAVEAIITFDGGNKFPYQFTLEPENHWRVVSWSRPESYGLSKGTNQYQGDPQWYFYPNEVTWIDVYSSGEIAKQTRYSFTNPGKCQMPDEAFTLAHYGLEPNQTVPQATKSSWWTTTRILLVVNGLIVFVLLFLLWRRQGAKD